MTLLSSAAYAFLRDSFVASSDSYGYYSLAVLFEQGRMTLPVGLDAARFPAVAPLGYVAFDRLATVPSV